MLENVIVMILVKFMLVEIKIVFSRNIKKQIMIYTLGFVIRNHGESLLKGKSL